MRRELRMIGSHRVFRPGNPLAARLGRLRQRLASWSAPARRLVGRWLPDPEAADPASEAAAVAALGSDLPRVRWEAAAILRRDSQRSSEGIAALVAALADPEPFVRWHAAAALAAQETSRVFPVLTATLNDPEPLRRAGAAEALGRAGGEAAGMALRKVLADPDARVRMAAARSLGRCGDPTAIPALVPLLSDAEPDVCRSAAHALGRIGDPKAAMSLAEALARPEQPLLVRRALAAALVHTAHPNAQPMLLQALTDPDPQVRGYAAQALGQVGDERAHVALSALKADAAPLLRGTVGDMARSALSMLERRGRHGALQSDTATERPLREGDKRMTSPTPLGFHSEFQVPGDRSKPRPLTPSAQCAFTWSAMGPPGPMAAACSAWCRARCGRR